jgi:hypothetical protein
LIDAGRSVAEVAADLGMSGLAIYNWPRQLRIDRGELAGLTSSEQAGMSAARGKIAQLEAELAATRRVNDLPKGRCAQKALRKRSG